MKGYYEVVDNEWNDMCPHYPLTEEGLAKAILTAKEEQKFKDSMNEDFKVKIFKIHYEEVLF